MSETGFTQSPGQGFEESPGHARNTSGFVNPPEPDGPWWKIISATASGKGWKAWKSWEVHDDSDTDLAMKEWVQNTWGWLSMGETVGDGTGPTVEDHSDTLLLRERWEGTATGPTGATATIRHNTKLYAYAGGYSIDQWLYRIGDGPWSDWDPNGPLNTWDWLYGKMLEGTDLSFLAGRERAVSVFGAEANGTEVYTWDPSDDFPEGATTSVTCSYSRYNQPDEPWSVNVLNATVTSLLNSVQFDDMAINTSVSFSLSSTGAVVREDGGVGDVPANFPWPGSRTVASGSRDNFSNPVSTSSVSQMKSRVSWPEDPDQIINPYATAYRALQPGIPATSTYPGPDNSEDPHFEDYSYNIFDAAPNMKASFAIAMGEIVLGGAGMVPSESTAGPLSTGAGPTSTQ